MYDDNRVEDIDEENIVTKNAYILFYRLKKWKKLLNYNDVQ